MRILVVGAGVIGSVYAAKLLQAGHEVVLYARGDRLTDLQSHGLIVEDAESGQRTQLSVPVLSELAEHERYELVLVSVRAEQLADTLPVLLAMRDNSDVLFFGNTTGHQAQLVAALGERTLFGFPAAGGVRDGATIRYVLIRQQKTMLGEANGTTTPRVRQLQEVLSAAGFPTRISANIDGWMLGHAAFVVPIGCALSRVDTDSARLAADGSGLGLMVRATREVFRALGPCGNIEIPTNLRVLYLWVPTPFVVGYWRRVMASPRGELWFGAHTRAAPEEMRALAGELRTALRRAHRSTPYLDDLLRDPISSGLS